MQLLENSPHDFFWGGGWDASGHNHLGRLLMELREQLLRQVNQTAVSQHAAHSSNSPSAAASASAQQPAGV